MCVDTHIKEIMDGKDDDAVTIHSLFDSDASFNNVMLIDAVNWLPWNHFSECFLYMA